MPYIAEHYSVVEKNERLNPHNIGLKNEIAGLFLRYANTLTLFRTNNTMRWEITADVIDFAIDKKNGLVFYTVSGAVVCVSLKTGERIWQHSLSSAKKIACSPKHKLIYITVGNTVVCYDYQFNLVGSINHTIPHKPAVLDKLDLVVIHTNGYSGSNTVKRRVTTPQLVNIASVTDTTAVNAPAPYRYQDGRVFWMPGTYMYYSDVVNSPTVDSQIGPSVSISSSAWTREMVRTVDGQFAYFLGSTNAGNPHTTYRLYKIDIENDVLIWQVVVGRTNDGYTNNEYSLTNDANSVYVAINPRNTSNGIVKEIIVVDKDTAEISCLPFNPDVFVNDANIQVYHTYDIPI